MYCDIDRDSNYILGEEHMLVLAPSKIYCDFPQFHQANGEIIGPPWNRSGSLPFKSLPIFHHPLSDCGMSAESQNGGTSRDGLC
jgi:hypothetical protein